MIDRQEVTLDIVTASSAPILANLLELYVHDLSGVFAIDLGADGRFGYDRLPLYWSEPDAHFAFFVRVGGRLAGFALVTRGSPATDDPADLDVAEFFILRLYRRARVGRRAAFLLWDSLPGHWVVRVSEANHAGLGFWEPTIRDYTGGAFSKKQLPGTPHVFHVFTFATAPPIAAA
jgi:predicted acetyltransferase